MSEDRQIPVKAETRTSAAKTEKRSVLAAAGERAVHAAAETRTITVGRSSHIPPGHAGTQNLIVSLYNDGDTFFPVIIDRFGDLILAPSLYVDGDTFYGPVLEAGSVDITPDLYENEDTFFFQSLALGDDSIDLRPALYADGDSFYTSTVTPGAVGLTPGIYVDLNVFHAPSIGFDRNLAPNLFVDADTFYAARISDFILRPALFTEGDVFYSPAVGSGQLLDPLAMLGQQVDMAWFQEDLADGEVGAWVSRGRRSTNAAQATFANRPTKLAGNGGVYFAKGATKWLQWAVDTENVWSHRWWIVIARANVNDGTGISPAVVCHGSGTNNVSRQPYIFFNGTGKTLNDALYDSGSKTLSATLPGGNTFADWHIDIGYRRGFKHGARIDGVDKGLQDFIAFRRNDASAINTLGGTAAMSFDLAIDCVLFGDGELTDYQLDVLEGWAHWRVAKQANLSVSHPFKNAAPLTSDFGASDLHGVFEFDLTAWNTWLTDTNTIRFTHRGEATYSEAGYSTVFFTDFDLADQLPVSDLTGTQNAPWFAPGWLDTLDHEASLRNSSAQPWPLAYVQNTGAAAGGAGRPGTLALHMYNDGSWKSGAMYSVNHQGIGRAWGRGIYKVRCKFTGTPTLTGAPYPGFFPAPLWSYALEHLIQRTRNRIEPDFIELTGKNQAWNEGSLHVHTASISYPSDATISTIAQDKKIYGYSALTTTDADLPNINVFDGNFHEWICKIEGDYTYFWVDGEELARCPTHVALLKPKYLISNFALDAGSGDRTPLTTEMFDMMIDYVEVMQKSTDLDDVPTGFSALPTIGGTAGLGSTLTVTPNTSGTQIEYRWYRDGVPIVTPAGATYVLLAADVGHAIRVQVKNKSLVNQPEAWTAETATVT